MSRPRRSARSRSSRAAAASCRRGDAGRRSRERPAARYLWEWRSSGARRRAEQALLASFTERMPLGAHALPSPFRLAAVPLIPKTTCRALPPQVGHSHYSASYGASKRGTSPFFGTRRRSPDRGTPKKSHHQWVCPVRTVCSDSVRRVRTRFPLRLEILLARATGGLSRLTRTGGGTTMPGKLLWKIDPDAVDELGRRLTRGSALLSATNGKTTTAAMTARILADKSRLAHNSSGANLVSGIASTLLTARDAELGLFEVDEAALPEVSRRL